MIWLIKESVVVFFDCFRIGVESIRAKRCIRKLAGPIVTIFGGKEVHQDHVYAKQAYGLAAKLVEHGISVITGGGPGIMQAANCGALAQAKQDNIQQSCTLGIGVYGVDKEFTNPCAKVVFLSHFFMRKSFLMSNSCGIVVFPGGIGTADELWEVLNLIKIKKIERIPVVLFGVSYWQPMVDWFFNSGLDSGFIQQEHKDLLIITDDIDQALEVVRKGCRR